MACLSRLILSRAFIIAGVAVMPFCGACAGIGKAGRTDAEYKASPEYQARLSAQTEAELQERMEALERQARAVPPVNSGFMPPSTTCQRSGDVLNCSTTQGPNTRYFTCRNHGGNLACD